MQTSNKNFAYKSIKIRFSPRRRAYFLKITLHRSCSLSWTILCLSWAILGLSWAYLGPILGHLWHLGWHLLGFCFWFCFVWWHSWSYLGMSCAILGLSWSIFGPILALLERFWASPGWVLDLFSLSLAALRPILGHLCPLASKMPEAA